MRQSKFLILLGILAGLLSGGCGSSIHDSAAPGPIDRGLYRDAVNENQQRIAGEDHRVVPLYETPMTAVDVAYEQAIGNPLAHLFSLMSGSTPGYWARRMFDPSSADIRREAILK